MARTNLLTIYFSFCLFALPSTSQECKAFTFSSGLIINGEDTVRGEFPFLVALVNLVRQRFFCGANLISQRHALTAAHCVFDKFHTKATDKEDFVGLLGKYNLKNPFETDVAVKEIQEMVIHEDWKPHVWRFDADIAILIFTSEVQLSKYIKTVCLPLPSSMTDYLKEGHVVGWGVSERTGIQETEGTPRKTKMKKPPTNENCFIDNNNLATLSSNRTFCAEGENSGPCLGDSGGGFFVNSNLIWTIQGIVSAALVNSVGECDVSKLSVFTNVAHYIDWINDNSNGTIYPIAMDNKIKDWIVTTPMEGEEAGGMLVKIVLTCEYKMNYDDDYVCRVYDLDIRTKNTVVESFTGAHEIGKSDEDVQKIDFATGIMHYLPNGIGKLYKNVEEVEVYNELGTKLITQANFHNLEKLRILEVYRNEIEILPFDTLWELPVLEVFGLKGNKLKALDERTFEKNVKLKTVDLNDNPLEFLPRNLFKNNRLLEIVNFNGNAFKNIATDFSALTSVNQIYLEGTGCSNICYSRENRICENDLLEFQRQIVSRCTSQN